MDARVTDIKVVSPYEAERARIWNEQAAAVAAKEFEVATAQKEAATLAQFVKRLVAGGSLRRASDRRCEALLIETATPDVKAILQGLLHTKEEPCLTIAR